ncbi:MAG: hypothetical protein ACLU6Y_05740 [Ruminococcus sp.]
MSTPWKTIHLTIDVIYGNKYRKTAHELDLRELEMIAPHWHQAVAKYKKNGGTEHLKKYDYTSYEEDTPYYTHDHKGGRTQDQTPFGSYPGDAPYHQNQVSAESLFCII